MGRNDADETPPEMRWWARIDDECPITLEPINTMTTAPFFLDGSYFDADSLHGYLIDTGRLENPCTRAPLSRAVCRALDEHVGDGSRRVEALHAQESAGADREAAVVTNALLDYYSQNRASCGGMRVVDDDEAPFVNAEADAVEEAVSVARGPAAARARGPERGLRGFGAAARRGGRRRRGPARPLALAVAADRRRAAREAEKGARRIAAEAARREAVAARTEAEERRRRDDERKRRDALAEARAWAAAKAERAPPPPRARGRPRRSQARGGSRRRRRRRGRRALGGAWCGARRRSAASAAAAAERRREKKARERQRLCGNQPVRRVRQTRGRRGRLVGAVR